MANGRDEALTQDEQEQEEGLSESREDNTVDDCSKRFTDSIGEILLAYQIL